MHPITLHVNTLAVEVEKNLAGTEVTPHSLRRAIDHLCTHESPQIRSRVTDEVRRLLGSADDVLAATTESTD